jgi:hypothetical protein
MRKTGKKRDSTESALKFGTTSDLKLRIANLANPVEKERVPQQPARHYAPAHDRRSRT